MKQFLMDLPTKSNALRRDENKNPHNQSHGSFYGDNYGSTSKHLIMVNTFEPRNKSSQNNQRILLKMVSPNLQNMNRNIQNYLMPNLRNKNTNHLSTDFNSDSVFFINSENPLTHTSSPKSSQISSNTPSSGPPYLDLLQEYLSYTLFTPDEKLFTINMIRNIGEKDESNVDLPHQHLLRLVTTLENQLSIERANAQYKNIILDETRIKLEKKEALISILHRIILRYQNSVDISKSNGEINQVQSNPNKAFKIELLKAAGSHSSNTIFPKASSTYTVYKETNPMQNSFDSSMDKEGGFDHVYIPKETSIGSHSLMNLTTDSNPKMIINYIREKLLDNCKQIGLFDENLLKSMPPFNLIQCIDHLSNEYLQIKDKLKNINTHVDLLNNDVSTLKTHYENISDNISGLVNYIFENIYDPNFLQNFHSILTHLSKQWEVGNDVPLQNNTREFMNAKFRSFCNDVENMSSVAQRCIKPEKPIHLTSEVKQSFFKILEIIFKDLLKFVDEKINIDLKNNEQIKNIPIHDMSEYHLNTEQISIMLGTDYDKFSSIIDDFILTLCQIIQSKMQLEQSNPCSSSIPLHINISEQNEQALVITQNAENILTIETHHLTHSPKLNETKDISIIVESDTDINESSAVLTDELKRENNEDSSSFNIENDPEYDIDLPQVNVSDSNTKFAASSQPVINLKELEHKLSEKEAEINKLKEFNMNKPFVNILEKAIFSLDTSKSSILPRENTNSILDNLKTVFIELKNALESSNCETMHSSIHEGVEVSSTVDEQNLSYNEFTNLIEDTIKNAKISNEKVLDLDFELQKTNGQLILKNEELETAKESIQNLEEVIAEKDLNFNFLHEFYQRHMINSVNLQQQQYAQIQKESNELLELAKSLKSEVENIEESSNIESNAESDDEPPSSEVDLVNTSLTSIKKKPWVSTPGLDDSIRRAEEALYDIKQKKDEMITYNEKSHKYFDVYVENLDRFKPKSIPPSDITSPVSDNTKITNNNVDSSASDKNELIESINDILSSIVDDDEEEDPLVS